METVALVLSVLSFLLCLAVAADAFPGFRRLTRLEDVPPAPDPLPRVSIVFGARDEEVSLERAVRSHLALDYADFEVIAVDDRSSDRTPEILARLARQDARLRALRVEELPGGWLGKCNALWLGSAAARGEWLLFTDADVVMDPTILRRAMALVMRHGLDHLTIAPYAQMPGILLQAFTASFGLFFSMFARPWKIPDPRSSAHAGIGAFNLVRAEAYRAIGGHEKIRLRPDDDMRLGKVIKSAGFRPGFALGQALIAVEWYRNLPALVRGLSKAAFAGLDYSLIKTVMATLVQVLLFLWPLAGLLWGGWTALFCVGSCLLFTTLYLDQARLHNVPVWTAILFPVCCALFLWIVWSSALKTLSRGGIEWRGTFYPIGELRKGLS
jgi:glycosyltransferase involved in cell wall biosynthesis